MHPVKPSTDEKAQLNTCIPRGFLKRIKSYRVDKDLSLRDINILALKFFLDEKALLLSFFDL
jgi:hypothetical protein